jgi:hypothetical protein
MKYVILWYLSIVSILAWWLDFEMLQSWELMQAYFWYSSFVCIVLILPSIAVFGAFAMLLSGCDLFNDVVKIAKDKAGE